MVTRQELYGTHGSSRAIGYAIAKRCFVLQLPSCGITTFGALGLIYVYTAVLQLGR